MSDTGSKSNGRSSELAEQARAMSLDTRTRFLDAQCGTDAGLRHEVDSILAAEDERVRGSLAQTIDPSTAAIVEKQDAQQGQSRKSGKLESDARNAATVATPEEARTPPQRIGPYKLLEMIGEGGFGTVWLADQTAPVRRRVALKIIKPGMDSKAIVARFEQERQALAIMEHPNIAKVLDAGTSPDGRPYFVMEYVAGESVTAYCDRNRLSVKQRLELFLPICDAVQHAHHKGIIHRDIKPTNVLVSVMTGAGASIKVIDFGVAKAVSHVLTDKTLFTEQGQILGTPEYMSPEQAEMGALDIDTRTDVYSLGVLLYELLTGALPFEPKDPRSRGYNEIQRIIREVDPPRPSTRLRSLGVKSAEVAQRRHMKLEELEGQLRRELEWIPLKAMRKDRDERYRTPSDMADDIRNHLAGRPLMAGPESVMYRAKKFVYRNRWGVSAAAAVVVALLVGGIVSTIGFVQSARNAHRAEQNATLYREQRDRAEVENKRLWQQQVYNTSLLANANPTKGEPKDVTVRALLDNAALQLDNGAQNGQPLIEAALRMTLGETYRSLSLWEQSETQFRKSLALARQGAGDDSPAAAEALCGLGAVLLDTGRVGEAEESLKAALLIQREQLSGDHPFLGDTISQLGALAAARGDLPTAEARYREALAIYEKSPGATPRVADAMTNLATVLHTRGDNKQAIALATDALKLRRQQFGDAHIDVFNSLINLASMEEAEDDLATAEALRREALALSKQLLEEKNRKTIESMNQLARTLWLRGGASLAEAETVQKQAVVVAEEVDGRQSQTVARGIDLLACIARDRGQLAQAVELFRTVLDIRTTLQTPQHPDTAAAMSQLADALTRAGQKPDEAVKLATDALAIRRSVFPPGHWAIWNTTSVLGGALAAEGQFDHAEPLLLESYKGLEAGSVLGKRPRIDAATRLVVLYEKWGKPDQAKTWRETRDQLAGPTTQPAGASGTLSRL